MPIKTHFFLFPIYIIAVLLNSGDDVFAALHPKALFLNCGSKDSGDDADGRKWVSDSEYLASADKTVEVAAQVQDPSLPSTTPYMTARVFTSETAYNFPINGNERYFLRLYFYPSTYPNFNTSNSYFSVVAGGSITLLNNFSASISAEALTQSYIIKEYSLAPFKTDSLSLVFKPSDQYKNSFAFLNGIELIPTPELFGEASTVGGDQQMDTTDKSFETMWRLNVGGKYIAPMNDSDGLGRSWYDDSPYIFGGFIGVPHVGNMTKALYSKINESVAPISVYETDRELGPLQPEIALQTNLSWVFQVDANFTYLVRLHFCDFNSKRPNEKVFNVFINNNTAYQSADIVSLAGNKPGVAMYQDYITFQPAGADNNLWVSLQPDNSMKPQYLDVILNGLEIFRVGDSSSPLAGPNPDLSDLKRRNSEEAHKGFQRENNKVMTSAIIGGTAGVAAAFALVAAAVFGLKMKKRRIGRNQSRSNTTSWLPLYNSHTNSDTKTSGKSHGSTNISSSAAANCRYFSLSEIREATKNFDESNVIGVGGFGKVYKGIIDNGNTKVAIKRSNPSSEQGVNEFQTEIEMLSKLRHRHLVSLIGFCEDNGEMILVYDYMGRGTLREHIYKGNTVTLSWKQRLEICIGAARGLHYLHTGAQYTIIHRDVKTTNILVDEKWVAKVSDFGLSKTGPNMNQGHVSTVVKGSFGYLDPEYFRRQQLTEKSDVYSFGVVLFEVLCARPALNPSLPKEQVSLADWACYCQRKGTLEDIIDPQLKGKIKPECLKKFADTAEKCLSDHGTDRPSMGDVLWTLEWILQMESDGDGSVKKKRSSEESVENEHPEEKMDNSSLMAMHRNTLSLGSSIDDEDDDVAEKKDDSTSDIFSQIVRPTGR